MSSVTFSPSVGGDGSTVTDDSNATTGLDGGGHRTRFVPALAQVVAVAANTVTKAGEASSSASAAAAQVPLAAAHAATAATQATASASSAAAANTSASAASASATSAATSATSAGAAAVTAANTLISAVTQRPAIRPSLSVDWTLKPTAAALTAAGWTISRAGEMTYFGPTPVKVAENLFVQSKSFSTGASWGRNSCTVSAVTHSTGLQGFSLVQDSGAGAAKIFQSFAAANLGSGNYKVRFLLAAGAYTKAIISNNTRGAAAFDLSGSGAVLNSGSTLPGGASAGTGYVGASITPHQLGSGLFWCEVETTPPAAGTGWWPGVIGYPDAGATLDSSVGATCAGDGVSGIQIFAAQIQHNFDGDYVETTSAQITQYASPLLTAATNELAYQHNANGECTGLLSYPADTNLLLHSQNFGVSPWGGTGILTTAAKRLWAGYAPFWRISRTDTTAGRVSSQSVATSVGAGTKYTLSVALLGDRFSGNTVVSVGVRGNLNTSWGDNADSAAAIISGSGSISQRAGGLFDISGLSFDTPTVIRITRTYPLADTLVGAFIYPGGSTATAIGAAILATRAHLSASPRYMPYIPTTGSTATRAAQTVALGPSTNPLGPAAFAAANNPIQGTLLARASVEDLVFEGRAILSMDFSGNSAFRNYIGSVIGGGAGIAQTNTAGVLQTSCQAGAWSTVPQTAAYSYAANNFQLAMSGSLSPMDSSGLVPVVNQLVSNSWAGLIQRTELYPRAMTSAELAAITTPGVLV